MKKLLRVFLVLVLFILQAPTYFQTAKISQITAESYVLKEVPKVRLEVSGTSINVSNEIEFINAYKNNNINIINMTKNITLNNPIIMSSTSTRNLKINGNNFILSYGSNAANSMLLFDGNVLHLQNIVFDKTSDSITNVILSSGTKTDFILENLSSTTTSKKWKNIIKTSQRTDEDESIFIRGNIQNLITESYTPGTEFLSTINTVVFEENSKFTYTSDGAIPFFGNFNSKAFFAKNTDVYFSMKSQEGNFINFSEITFYSGSKVIMENNNGIVFGKTSGVTKNSVDRLISVDSEANLLLKANGTYHVITDDGINSSTRINVNPTGSLEIIANNKAPINFTNEKSKISADNPKLLDIKDVSTNNSVFLNNSIFNLEILNSNIALWEKTKNQSSLATPLSPFNNVSLVANEKGLQNGTTENTFSKMNGGYDINKYARIKSGNNIVLPEININNQSTVLGQPLVLNFTTTPINSTVNFKNYDQTALLFSNTTVTGLKLGTFLVTVEVTSPEGFKSSKNFNLIVTPPPPTLNIDQNVIILPLNAPTPNLLSGVSGKDYLSKDLVVKTTGVVDTTKQGAYKITYQITDSFGQIVTKTRTYLIGDVIVNKDYAVFSENYTTRIGLVNFDLIDLSYFLEKNKISLYEISTDKYIEKSKYEVIKKDLDQNKPFTKTPGNYGFIYQINYNSTTINKTAYFELTGGALPVINTSLFQEITLGSTFNHNVSASDLEDNDLTSKIKISGDVLVNVAGVYKVVYTVTDSDFNTRSLTKVVLVNDGNYKVGTNYIIEAHDFLKRISEVNTQESVILSHANAKLYSKSTGLVVNDILKITSSGYKKEVGIYNMTYTSSLEPTLNILKSATVSKGNAPVLTGASFSEVSLNGVYNPLAGISVSDVEDQDIASKIMIDKTINTAVAGVYKVIYTVTDSDLNTVTLVKIVLVNDGTYVVGANSIIKANDFTRRISQVSTLEAAIIGAANAKQYSKVTGLEIAPPTVSDLGGYQAIARIYNISLKGIDGQVKIINATVTGGSIPVLNVPEISEIQINRFFDPMSLVSATDTEDSKLTITYSGSFNINVAGIYVLTYKVVDSDLNEVIKKRTVVVNDGNYKVGSTYIIRAFSFSKRLSEVDTSNMAIINAANVQVFSLNGQLVLKDVNVNKGLYSATIGTYPITFSVVSDSGTSIIKNATVDSGNVPKIEGILFKEIPKGTVFNALDGVSSKDDEDGVLTNRIVVSSNLNTNIAGLYTITYQVTDNDSNVTTQLRVVLVNDGNYVVGTNYIIKASDVTQRLSQVNVTNNAMIASANVLVYAKETGAQVLENVVIDKGNYFVNGVFSYNIVYKVEKELTTSILKKINIVTGELPAISGPDFTEVIKGSSFNVNAGITFSDVEDNLDSSHLSVVGKVDVNTPGVYKLVYTIVDNDLNKAQHTRIVLVNDGSYTVGATHIIKADNFSKRVGEVVVSEKAILSSSNAKIYSKVTGMIDGTIIVSNYGNYNQAVNQYTIVLKGQNNDATISIVANVNAGNIPNLVVSNFKEVSVAGDFDPLEGVKASDVEDSSLVIVERLFKTTL